MTYQELRMQYILNDRPLPEKKVYKIPTMSAKRKAKESEGKELFAADKEFYAEHWAAHPRTCEECNKNLGKEPLTLFFHHALPKRNYPQFRHDHFNIICLCPDCHSQAETDLDKVPKTKARTEQIKKLLNSSNDV